LINLKRTIIHRGIDMETTYQKAFERLVNSPKYQGYYRMKTVKEITDPSLQAMIVDFMDVLFPEFD